MGCYQTKVLQTGTPRYSKLYQISTTASVLQNNGHSKLALRTQIEPHTPQLEQGDLLVNNHPVCSHSTRTDSLLMTMIWTPTPSQNQTCCQNPDHSCTGWMIECERWWTNPQKMQHKTTINIIQYGECLCLQHYKHRYSWEEFLRNFTFHRSRGTSWTTLVRSSICRIAMEETIRRSFIGAWMGENSELGMYVRSS